MSDKHSGWLAIQVPVTPETSEILSYYLFEMGCLGCQQTEDNLVAYFPADRDGNTLMAELNSHVADLIGLGFNLRHFEAVSNDIPDQDWNLEWQKYFKPLRVSARFFVKPTWEHFEAPDGVDIIEIDPKQAFGTGSHASTQLVLRLLESHLHGGETILDVGTGSGILSIAAAKLGSGSIVSLDIDPVAVLAARENVKMNHCGGPVILYTGATNALKSGLSFDLLLANITRNVILAQIELLYELVKPGGCCIMSGVLIEEFNVLHETVRKFPGFLLHERMTEGEWIGLVYRKELS